MPGDIIKRAAEAFFMIMVIILLLALFLYPIYVLVFK